MKSDWHYLLAAWLVAMFATWGALFIGEVMLLPPSNLCWYQRILMFPMAIILGIACFSDDRRGVVYAMPFALIGTAVAAYHTLLVWGLIPRRWIPCGPGNSCISQQLEILGGVQIPWLLLVAFLLILSLLAFYLGRASK